MPKISIIIPVYNTEKYLEKCLDSVINQTLQDIEIICVDDCSTDNSLKILEEYKDKDSRIKILKNEENKGQGYSRNKAIEYAQGEYIGFTDSDDEVEKNYGEYLYERAEKEEADISCARIMYYDESNGERRWGDWALPADINGEILETIEEKIGRVYCNCSTSPCKHIYKRSFLERHGIQFASGVFHEDQYFNLCAYYFSNKILSEEYSSPLYFYYIHENSSMNKNVASPLYKKTKFDQFKVIEKSLNFLKTQNASKEVINTIIRAFEIIVYSGLLSIDKYYMQEYANEALKLNFSKEFSNKVKWFCFDKFNANKDLNKLIEKVNAIKKIIIEGKI